MIGGVAMMQYLVIGVQSLILLEGFVWSFCNLSGCMKLKTRSQTQMHTGSSLDHVFVSKWTKKKNKSTKILWLRNVNEAITRQVVLGMDSFLSVPVLCMDWSTVSMLKVTKCQVFIIPQSVLESCASNGFLYTYNPISFLLHGMLWIS